MQIKTTMSDHLIRVRMSIIKTTTYSTEDNTRKEETGPVIDGTTNPEVPAFQSYSRPGKKSRAPPSPAQTNSIKFTSDRENKSQYS